MKLYRDIDLDIDSGNGLLPDCSKSMPEPVLTSY